MSPENNVWLNSLLSLDFYFVVKKWNFILPLKTGTIPNGSCKNFLVINENFVSVGKLLEKHLQPANLRPVKDVIENLHAKVYAPDIDFAR